MTKGLIFFIEKTVNLLSFPPVAISSDEGHNFNPQIYWLWALYLITYLLSLKSWILTKPSLPPVQIKFCEQPTDPIRP